VLERLFYAVGFEEVLTGLFAPLAASYFTVVGEQDLPAMADRQIRALEEKFQTLKARILRTAEAIAALPADAGASVAAAAESCARLLPAISSLGFDDASRDRRDTVEELFAYRLPGGKTSRDEVITLKKMTAEGREERRKLLLLWDALAGGAEYREVFALLAEFRERVLADRRRSGIVSFSDIMEMAIDLLKTDTELRAGLKQRFRFIMVDEFQDTNMLQKELIYLLGERRGSCAPGVPAPEDLEPGKLFFVGDEKQSIYRFRGADVGVFKALIREIGRAGGRSLPLPSNYRSDPGLIAFFNEIFSRVFVSGGPDYEAEFSPLLPGGGGSGNPLIRVFHKPYGMEPPENALTSDEAEGFWIARFVRDAVEKGILDVRDEKTGMTRKAGYGDFALLMRSTGSQITYERMFRRLGIPYRTQNIRSLFLEAPVNDIYCLLQCVVHPEDRTAYAGLLRSPFVNLSDDTLIAHLLSLGEDDLPFAPETLPEETPPDDSVKYRAGRDLYREIGSLADRVSIRRILFTLWFTKGYRFSVLRNSSWHGYLEFYPYLVSLADQAEARGMNLSRFVDSLRINLGKYEKMDELPVEEDEDSGVRFMTIHKSKGLEFPIVIVANTETRIRGRPGALQDLARTRLDPAEFPAGRRGRRTGKDVFFEDAKEEERLRETAEARRLLYVACTRARDHLIISGCHHRNNQNTEDNHLNMVLSALDAAGKSAEFVETIPDATEEDLTRRAVRRVSSRAEEFMPLYTAETAPALRGVSREIGVTELSRRWLETRKALGSGSSAGTGRRESLPGLPSDEPLRRYGLEAEFGTLCHLLIERGMKGGEAADSTPIPSAIAEAFPEECREAAFADARALAGRFLASPLGRRASEAKRKESEYPFLYRFDTRSGPWFVRGVFDLLFLTGETTVLVDFKSDLLFDPDDYLVQLFIYARAAGELFGTPVDVRFFTLRDSRERPVVFPADFSLSDSLFSQNPDSPD
jgi:ATP-dependent exoDNAse (exonuclease V) beta subunit